MYEARFGNVEISYMRELAVLDDIQQMIDVEYAHGSNYEWMDEIINTLTYRRRYLEIRLLELTSAINSEND